MASSRRAVSFSARLPPLKNGAVSASDKTQLTLEKADCKDRTLPVVEYSESYPAPTSPPRALASDCASSKSWFTTASASVTTSPHSLASSSSAASAGDLTLRVSFFRSSANVVTKPGATSSNSTPSFGAPPGVSGSSTRGRAGRRIPGAMSGENKPLPPDGHVAEVAGEGGGAAAAAMMMLSCCASFVFKSWMILLLSSSSQFSLSIASVL